MSSVASLSDEPVSASVPRTSTADAPQAADAASTTAPATAQPPAEAPAPTPFFVMSQTRALAYFLSSTLLALLQGLNMNFASVNLYQLQGSLHVTVNEAIWLTAAYMAPYASMSLALVRIRNHFGLRRFAEISIAVFVLASLLNLAVNDLNSGIVVRFISGMAAAPLSSLAFFYMLEPFPRERKFAYGLPLALANTSISAPLAQLVSPHLINFGGWQGLYTFELAMALMAFPIIYLLPLTPLPHGKVIEKLDFLSYPLLGIGFGCIAVTLAVGRLYWWFEAPWIGILLAVACAALTAHVLIELQREKPLVDVRWLLTRDNIHLGLVLLVFRVIASEQSSVAVNFFTNLGLTNDLMPRLYVIMILSGLAGAWSCCFFLRKNWIAGSHIFALVLMALGAFMDSHATSLTRPEQMYLSQAMVAAGAAMFLPTAMAKGFGTALVKGPQYVLTFLVIFLFTQSIGGLIGSAVFGTFMQIRQRVHLQALLENFVLIDPMVAARVQTYATAYGKVVTDKLAANSQGISAVYQTISRESYVLAYNDTFFLISMVAVAALVALIAHLSFNLAKKRISDAVRRPAVAQ